MQSKNKKREIRTGKSPTGKVATQKKALAKTPKKKSTVLWSNQYGDSKTFGTKKVGK